MRARPLQQFIIWLFTIIMLVACAPTTEETSMAQSPEIFVFASGTEERLISTEDIPQDNCDGSAEKSNTVERSHTVLRTLELGTDITVDASGKAGVPGIGEVGLGAAVASHYQVSYGSQDTVTRSITVAAKEGTNILHTVRQYEIWEIGEVLVSAGGLNQRLPFSFRRDFNMETLPPANLGCPGSNTIRPIITTPVVTVSSSAQGSQPESGSLSDDEASQSTYPTPKPPNSISRDEVLRLNFGEVTIEEVNRCIDQAHAGPRPFVSITLADMIPANVLIASNFFAGGTIWSELPVVPICHNGSWGLFESSEPFQAPYEGAYWHIVP